MKVRRRKYKTEQEVPSYWPSFVDIMTTVTLVFFFILLTSIGISSIFVDNIAVERETVYDKIQGELNQYAVNEEVMNFNREEGKIDIKTETFFDSDSSVLKEDGKKLASELGDIFFKLLSNEDIKEKIDYIEIVGHTDFAGSTIHGRELSTERAISFLNEMMPEDSELENLHGEKFKASGMSEFENYASKEERDRGYDEYNIEETKKDRRIEVRMVFSNEDLEKAIKELNKSLEEYYDNEYSAVGNTKESNKNFPYSLEALVAIFNNSLDLYSDDENTWDTLNLAYNKCNHKLNKVKEVLSDNEAIQEFTGLKPIEKEEVKEEKVKEDNVKTKGEFEIATEDLKDEDDGDLIVNNDKLNIYYVRISRNEDESINLNLCVKNKFNKNIIVESKDVNVNGIDTNPKFSISVLAGEKSFDKMVFNTDIAELVNLKCTFVIKDENTNEVLEECSIDIFKED